MDFVTYVIAFWTIWKLLDFVAHKMFPNYFRCPNCNLTLNQPEAIPEEVVVNSPSKITFVESEIADEKSLLGFLNTAEQHELFSFLGARRTSTVIKHRRFQSMDDLNLKLSAKIIALTKRYLKNRDQELLRISHRNS